MSVRRREHRDRGAAAVEFALVVPVLLLLVFGIIDFGLFFSDSLSARQGVREAARQGAVENWSATSCSGRPGSGDANLRRIACLGIDRTGAVAGDVYARVETTRAWTEGDDVTVCVVVRENGVTGFTPLPGDGVLRSAVTMRIETDTTRPRPNGPAMASDSGLSPSSPPGGWGWC